MISAIATPEVLDRGPVVVAFDRFLNLSVADGAASPRTIQAYREGLNGFRVWCASQLPPLDARVLTQSDIEKYRFFLIKSDYKPKTVSLRLTAVRVLFSALKKYGVRLDNPAEDVRAPKADESASSSVLRKALSPEEARKLLAVLPKTWAPQDIRDATIVRLLLYHGLRAAEVASLDSQDVDYTSFSVLRVLGKGNKRRTLLLCPEARQDLIAWTKADSHPQTIGTPLFHRFDVPGYMRLSVRAIERIVDHYLTKSGLKQAGRSVHALRHTYGLLATLGGADQVAVADSMGHSDTRTTFIYTRAAAAFLDNPSIAVGKALELPTEKS